MTIGELRRRVIARPRAWQTASWVGLTLGGAATVLAVNGAWAWAAVCAIASVGVLWLAGTWFSPWSRDGYLRTVSNALNAWAAEAEWAYSTYGRGQARLDEGLSRLTPPPSAADAHAKALTRLAAAGRLTRDESIPIGERVREGMAGSGAAKELKERAAAQLTSDAEKRYAAARDHLLARGRSEYATAADKAERATERTLARLERMRAPAAAQSEHEQFVVAFRGCLTALRRFHAAVQDDNPDRAAEAAANYEAAGNEIGPAFEAVMAALDYDARWAAAGPSGETPDGPMG